MGSSMEVACQSKSKVKSFWAYLKARMTAIPSKDSIDKKYHYRRQFPENFSL
jgi:hypothetical protein